MSKKTLRAVEKMPKAADPAEEQREPEREIPSSPSWAQRHGGLVFLLIVCGMIGFAILYELLKH